MGHAAAVTTITIVLHLPRTKLVAKYHFQLKMDDIDVLLDFIVLKTKPLVLKYRMSKLGEYLTLTLSGIPSPSVSIGPLPSKIVIKRFKIKKLTMAASRSYKYFL